MNVTGKDLTDTQAKESADLPDCAFAMSTIKIDKPAILQYMIHSPIFFWFRESSEHCRPGGTIRHYADSVFPWRRIRTKPGLVLCRKPERCGSDSSRGARSGLVEVDD
jgi:hypothetical protein